VSGGAGPNREAQPRGARTIQLDISSSEHDASAAGGPGTRQELERMEVVLSGGRYFAAVLPDSARMSERRRYTSTTGTA
jgi:hypothetical protein